MKYITFLDHYYSNHSNGGSIFHAVVFGNDVIYGRVFEVAPCDASASKFVASRQRTETASHASTASWGSYQDGVRTQPADRVHRVLFND